MQRPARPLCWEEAETSEHFAAEICHTAATCRPSISPCAERAGLITGGTAIDTSIEPWPLSTCMGPAGEFSPWQGAGHADKLLQECPQAGLEPQ
jgi:hypothetical protein